MEGSEGQRLLATWCPSGKCSVSSGNVCVAQSGLLLPCSLIAVLLCIWHMSVRIAELPVTSTAASVVYLVQALVIACVEALPLPIGP